MPRQHKLVWFGVPHSGRKARLKAVLRTAVLAYCLVAAQAACGVEPDPPPHRVATGKADPRLASFDRRMADFLEKHHVPGAAVAVTHQGKLVHARGYGYADSDAREPVEPNSLFRIASISKPITAVAVLQLVEKGLLSLDDHLHDVLPLETEIQQAGKDFDVRQRAITIRHLLEHRGGWDRDKSFDPMFQSVRFARELGVPAPAGPADVIRAMLRVPLDFEPGERYAYSNFGYCLLGRIVERRSGQTYEHYVRDQICRPLGIESMRIGATALAGRAPGEVRYYHEGTGPSVFQGNLGQQVPWPYGGFYLEAMDAHGGWLASAVDLAKFAAAFTDPRRCPLLKPESIAAMHARPPGLAGYDEREQPRDTYYSLGWQNRTLDSGAINHWHTGSLPGTTTILIRRHDGRNFVALLNTRISPATKQLGLELDKLLHAAANDVVEWP